MSSYRRDGVRIQHDPHAPGMAEQYGAHGQTDAEGFDPYADTVGPGIYGGNVRRDASGKIVIGRQYQNHNPRPGPVYDGSGYSPMTRALHEGREAVIALLEQRPELVNEISTGGATPLHMCGMSRRSQPLTALLISRGGDIEAQDTYGYRPLHRMASNNLAVGALALLKAGASVNPPTEARGRGTPMDVARASHAFDVVRVLRQYDPSG
jgi:ankyrin repeat protein